METIKKPVVTRSRGREGRTGRTQEIPGSEITLCDVTVVDTSHHESV